MLRTSIFAIIASSALVVGAAIGTWRAPSRTVTSILLAFASGTLITAVAFDLFTEAFERGGAVSAGVGFLAGATVFILIDTWLDHRTAQRQASGSAVGLALLLGVTLDGMPENLAMGVSLITSGSPALLLAIFASNLPEAVVGAQRMRMSGMTSRHTMLIWTATAILLAAAVMAGYTALGELPTSALAWPLGFAAGAVLASLADTLMPEAFQEGGPKVAYATALGFLVSFLLSST